MGGGGILMVAGSGAYFSVMGQRPFTIGAVDDEFALLGIDRLDPTGSEGERVNLLRLTNGFDNPLTSIDVTVVDIGPPENLDIVDIETPNSLGPGESDYVSGVLSDCTGQPPVPVDLYIEAAGSGESVEGTRTVDVQCEVVTFDPYDCHDILDVPRAECAYQETGSTTIGTDRNGEVCITGDGGNAHVDVSNNVAIDGFLRIIDATDIGFTLGNNATVDGAINLHDAGTNVNATLRPNSHVAGDFCASGNQAVTIDIQPPSGQPDRAYRIGGHFTIESGSNIVADVGNNVEIGERVTVDASGDLNLSVGNNAIIEGSLTGKAGQNANVTISNNAEIHGSVTIETSGDANVTVQNNALIDGDLTVDAGGNANVNVANNAEIRGDRNY